MLRTALLSMMITLPLTGAALATDNKLLDTPRAEVVIPPDLEQKKATLTVEQIVNISTALEALDRYDRVSSDGKVVSMPYVFELRTRLDIAHDLEEARAVRRAYQAAVQARIAKMAGGGAAVPPDQQGAWVVENEAMLRASSGVRLRRIKISDLKLDENPVPATVLSVLLPILDEGK